MLGEERMLGSGVVDILKVGLSGLAFLLAYMSYRLLSRVGTQSASPGSLQNAQRFMTFTLVLVVLVVVSSTLDLYVKKEGASSLRDIGQCRDAVARIETASQDDRMTLEQLRATVNNQLPNCEPLLKKEDQEKKGGTP